MPNIVPHLNDIMTAIYGEQVRGAIHDAISEINNEVDASTSEALKTTVDALVSSSASMSDDMYAYSSISSSSTENGYKLVGGAGLKTSNSSYKLVKYPVTAGNSIRIVVDDKFQFQSSVTVPSSGSNNNLVGQVYGSCSSVIKVPTGATYVILSTLASSNIAAVYNAASDIEKLQSNAICNYGTSTISLFNSCNDVTENSILFISVSGGSTTLADFAFDAAGWLMTFNIPNSSVGVFQIAYPLNTQTQEMCIRSYRSGEWRAWTPISRSITIDNTLNITGAAADAKAAGNVINKVKSEESKRIEETYPQLRTVVGEIDLIIGGGVAPGTGGNSTGANLARFSSAKILDAPLMVYMDSTEYQYDIWCYSGPGTGSATESPTDQQYTSEKVVVSNKEDNNYFKMGFKRIDGADMTSGASDPTSDEYKILNTLRLCYMTDTTLTKKGIPADGKAVNDLMQQKLVYDTSPTENSTNIVNSGGLFNALRDGLFPHKTIARGQDINDYKNMGVWAVSTASIAANVSNWPCIDATTGEPTSGTLLVITHREYNSGASFGFVQFAITARRIWYRRYVVSDWQEWRYLYTDADFDFVDGVNSQIDTYLSGNGNALVSNEWLKTIKYYGHLFIDGINETATPVIPSESLYEIQMTKRLGFNIIEGHLQKTADDNYVVMHGDSGKLGYELVKVSDGSFDADTAINSLTLLELQTNYKYRSSIAKYQTAVGSADEWLQACTIAGMIPLVKCPDDTALQLAKKYCGNNFILYNGSRSQHKGMMMYYQYNLGATVADAKTTIDTAVENYGLPLMIETYDIGPNAYTLEDLTEIVQYAHSKGVLFGTTNCYYSTTISRCIKSQKSGTDICCSGWEIPDFDTGNLVNAIGDTTFSDFVTNGTVTGGNLVLQNTNTVSISAQNNVQLGKGVLKVRYTGKIDIEMGKYWQFGQTYTGDGKQEIVFSTYFLNESPTFTLKAKENNTTIISIVYKASKC